ncbi:hypothetical protein [Cyclobacterium sp. 1_MG-2023]|uniref:hypothetical protein n=1 Tax=Cyclobacterium sp. 1_MG-2023 TaxID=3062681 RepID=UPI0026E3756C|nr:hypothetical protein [Cyclobacterium sp. 1_MG-2023]
MPRKLLFFIYLIGFQATAQVTFNEKNSLLIIEVESVEGVGDWFRESVNIEGGTIHYLYSTTEHFKDPGNKTLKYPIEINNPGLYKIIWHSKVGKGNSSTDNNDTWLRVVGASDFFGKKENHIVRPHGICKDDCPEGAGKEGWFKVYSHGTTDWTWRTKTSDNDPHEIYVRINRKGTYTLEISARSAHHFLDRIVLYDPEKYPEEKVTNLTLPESESR